VPSSPWRPYILGYLKTVEDVDVYLVDGWYIRNNLQIEFTSCAEHYQFPDLVPLNEIWIDLGLTDWDMEYAIYYLLWERRYASQGDSYALAVKKSDERELEKRHEETGSPNPQLTTTERVPEVHKKLLCTTTDGLEVWLVDGELVRSLFFVDFTEGRNAGAPGSSYVPENEIWIDDQLLVGERGFVLFHELHEFHLIRDKGWNYLRAHRDSSAKELVLRHHPNRLEKALRKLGVEDFDNL